MDHWDDYRLVLALDRAGTLRAAAGDLGVNHATISRRLAGLVTRFGGEIFERVAGRYRTTGFGKEIVAAAMQMEVAAYRVERARRGMDGELAGEIRLSLPAPLALHLLADSLEAFRKLHPAIRLNVDVSNRFASVERAEADVVVRASASPGDDLVGLRLFPYALAHYAAPAYLERTAPEDLRWITSTDEKAVAQWIAASPYPDVPVGIRSNDPLLRHELARLGYGLVRDACYMADPASELVRLGDSRPVPHQDIWVLTHEDLRDVPRIKALMRHLADALRARRGLIEGTGETAC
ncbi:MAG: LysR family transcriptional regulator [Erythrobacter sp.]